MQAIFDPAPFHIIHYTCPSSIIDSMAKDRRSFVLTTFCFSALSRLSHSLIIPAVAFTTELSLAILVCLISSRYPTWYVVIPIQLRRAYFSTILWDQ